VNALVVPATVGGIVLSVSGGVAGMDTASIVAAQQHGYLGRSAPS
jgi:hypothetical protein